MEDIYAIREDGPNYMTSAANDTVRKRSYDREHPRDAVEYVRPSEWAGDLERSEYFELVIGADELEEVLGGTADEAVDAIASGEFDDALGALVVAEEANDNRVTVLEAISDRQRYTANMASDPQA